MCTPKVFKSRARPLEWKWCWNCLEHNKVIKGYESMMEAFGSAELHQLYHEGNITQSQFMTTSVHRLKIKGAPRLVHLFDQFMGEVRSQQERVIDAFLCEPKSEPELETEH